MDLNEEVVARLRSGLSILAAGIDGGRGESAEADVASACRWLIESVAVHVADAAIAPRFWSVFGSAAAGDDGYARARVCVCVCI